MVLLMDQVTERDIGWHTMTRRNRERPGKWHERSLTVTTGHPLDTAHNPKVAGSNPAPATKKAQVRHHVGPGLVASVQPRCNPLQPNAGGDAVQFRFMLDTVAPVGG